MLQFVNHVVVIVGGSSGIGRECALQFAKQGGQVVLVARRQEELEKVMNEIRRQYGRVEAFTTDVTDYVAVNDVANQIKRRYGKVDVLIYSAGSFHLSPSETLNIQIARQVMDVNYWGALHVTKVFLPLLRKGVRRSLVFISSLSVPCTPAFFTAYAAPKHALHGFIKSLRQELYPEGIHVAEVFPGPVHTPMIEGHIHQAMYRLPPGIPVIKPETVAKGVLNAVINRKNQSVIPRRLNLAARFSIAFPSLLDTYYRRSIRGWTKGLQMGKQSIVDTEPEPTSLMQSELEES